MLSKKAGQRSRDQRAIQWATWCSVLANLPQCHGGHSLWGCELRRNGPRGIIPSSSTSQPTETPASPSKHIIIDIVTCPLYLEGKVSMLVIDDLEIKCTRRSFSLHGSAPPSFCKLVCISLPPLLLPTIIASLTWPGILGRVQAGVTVSQS